MDNTKQQLRKEYTLLRKKLSIEQRETFAQQVAQKFMTLPLDEFQTIHVFISQENLNELNTKFLINQLWKQNKTVVTSIIIDNEIAHAIISPNSQYITNKWGIKQPVDTEIISITAVDVICIPLLISDKNNHRVGYGKGIYDQILSQVSPHCKKIGLNFFKPIHTIYDINPFDIKMDECIYP